jgi:hypothetical protein
MMRRLLWWCIWLFVSSQLSVAASSATNPNGKDGRFTKGKQRTTDD